jgi:hypothetical protein
MNGVDDEYFKTERRQAMLLNILFVWSSLHEKTSYRQGMHEVVAPLLMVLEIERSAWEMTSTDAQLASLDPLSPPSLSPPSHIFDPLSLRDAICSDDSIIESETYWLFERVMRDLEPLYSPVTGADEQPAIVHYCTKIQGTIAYM